MSNCDVNMTLISTKEAVFLKLYTFFQEFFSHRKYKFSNAVSSMFSSCLAPRCLYAIIAIKRAISLQNQQSECAPSEDSDQPGHPPSLIWVFAVRMKKAWVLSYPLSVQRRLIRLGRCPGWSESSLGAQSLCWFCHVAAQTWFTFTFCWAPREFQAQVFNACLGGPRKC